MKKLMSLCLILLLLLAGCGSNPETEADQEILPFSGGAGTEADPYRISTEADLLQMASLINDTATHSTYASSHYAITADIALNSKKDWMPIQEFSGVLDGAGHTISGMRIEWKASLFTQEAATCGFVGILRGTVQNLIFRDCSVACLEENSGEVGIVAGKARGGIIRNCHVTGNSAVAGTYHVGGICGNANDDTVLEDCSNTATVTGTGDIVCAGGIAGKAACRVADCTNAGAVTSTADAAGIICTSTGGTVNCVNTAAITAEGYAGGIVVSFNDGALNSKSNNPDLELKNCTNTGAVLSTGDPAGGIAVSCRTGSIIGCVNSGSVSSPEEVGGIFAYFQTSMFGAPCAYFRVVDCTNTGAVTNTDLSFLYPVGGICSRIYDCPTDLYFENCENQGVLTSGSRAGGIVGEGRFRTLTLESCTNTGAVEGVEYAGGLVGEIAPMNTDQEETILFEAKNCRNTGDVYCGKSQGYDGGVYVGGILGYVNELTGDSRFTDVIIEDCENTGKLTGSQESRAVHINDLCAGRMAA